MRAHSEKVMEKNRNVDVGNRAYWFEFNNAADLGLDDVTFLSLFSL